MEAIIKLDIKKLAVGIPSHCLDLSLPRVQFHPAQKKLIALTTYSIKNKEFVMNEYIPTKES